MSPVLPGVAAPPAPHSRERPTSVVSPLPRLRWEECNCLLCGGRNWTPLLRAPDRESQDAALWFTVVCCRDCGLCFTNPRPDPASMARFYAPDYGPHQVRLHHGRSASPCGSRGRLLDFGCGGGRFLERMHRRGWQVLGMDVSAAAVRRVRTELGLPALVGTLPHPALRPASFDRITMRQSLEHVHDPLAVLRAARRLLRPGGELEVAVPNIAGLPFRWFGAAWFALDLPRHLTHFTPSSLCLMLERAGFRPGPVRMVRHSSWLRASALRACRDRDRPLSHKPEAPAKDPLPFVFHKPEASAKDPPPSLTLQACAQRWLTLRPAARLATWGCALLGRADCIMVSARG